MTPEDIDRIAGQLNEANDIELHSILGKLRGFTCVVLHAGTEAQYRRWQRNTPYYLLSGRREVEAAK